MENSASSRKKQLIVGLAVLIVIVVIVAVAHGASKKDTSNPVTSSSTPSSTQTSSTSFKDGSYKGNANFSTPGGLDAIAVSLTIKNNVVSDVTTTTEAPDPESQSYDDQFLADYKQKVVGKSLDQIHVSRLSGASLTSEAFNNALQKIVDQAKA